MAGLQAEEQQQRQRQAEETRRQQQQQQQAEEPRQWQEQASEPQQKQQQGEEPRQQQHASEQQRQPQPPPQQQEAGEKSSLSGKRKMSAEEAAAFREKENLRLARQRVLQQLEASSNPRHRKVLEDALTALDEKLVTI